MNLSLLLKGVVLRGNYTLLRMRPGDGPPLSTLLSELATSQERLLRGIDKAPASKWDETNANFGTIRKAFYFLHFHEAYHAGQLALLRRLAGKKGAIQ